MPASFDRFESFDHNELNAKHCYFRCSRLPDVVEIKILDKNDQAAKYKIKNSVLQPSHLIQKF